MKPTIHYTRPFIKATSPAYIEDFQNKLIKTVSKFPELKADKITVGVTTSSTANAQILLADQIKIGYNPSVKPLFFVLGHELMHFVQYRIGTVPHGERSCDVWTLARDPLFSDRSPGYLTLNKSIRQKWPTYSHDAQKLSIQAIAHRENGMRQYISWLEKSINALAIGDE